MHYLRTPFVISLIGLGACSNNGGTFKATNAAPAAVINAPATESEFTTANTIEFVGTVADGNGLDDLQSIIWASSIDGELGQPEPDGQGTVRLQTTLSEGTHTITLDVVDAGALAANDSITLFINVSDQEPSAEITEPDQDADYTLGDNVALVGIVSDPNQDPDELEAVWTWEPSGGGSDTVIDTVTPSGNGTVEADWSTAPIGRHIVRLVVTDADGNVGTSQVSITVSDPATVDNDGDGSLASVDCDDNDANNFPGNPEVCDNADNDCSGEADDKDLDGDNHIDELCVDYMGSKSLDDCDDDDSTSFPGAAEAVDGVDNDCDGLIDEGTDEYDDDGDCYCEGSVCNGSSNAACATLGIDDCDDSDDTLNPEDIDGDGYSSCDDDCDDNDADVSPEDVDGDGVSACDGDCDDTDALLNINDEDGDNSTTCDGDCNDFDNTLTHRDLDGDGFSSCAGDCVDTDPYTNPIDNDGDGASACDGDCDDTDPLINDNDDDGDGFSICDGDCDDTDPALVPEDNDGDGASACIDCDDSNPNLNLQDVDGDGYSTCDDDCDDDDALISPFDGDGDGFSTCDNDCDDFSTAINPGVAEIELDGIDQDCDGGDLCYLDADEDGFGISTLVPGADLTCATDGVSTVSGDCDDGESSAFPGAAEIPGDGIDQDCDGFDNCYEDLDGDGIGSGVVIIGSGLSCTAPGESVQTDDCDDSDNTRFPGAVEGVADGIDQDCDGLEECYEDQDEDGFGFSTTVFDADLTCTAPGIAPAVGDCNDNLATVNPGAVEVVADGTDSNCDNMEDCYEDLDGDDFGSGVLVQSAVFTCLSAGTAAVTSDCDDNDATSNPGETEVVANGVDNDCDGFEDCFVDGDGDGFGEAGVVLASPDLVCTDPGEAEVAGDCDDDAALVYTGATEIEVNGIDEDCDGGDLCYVDADGDTYGDDAGGFLAGTDLNCTTNGVADRLGDCDDSAGAVNPGETDVPDPTWTDNDCDGVDGVKNEGMYVDSLNGDDANQCSQNFPCESISRGIEAAAAAGRPNVYIASGTYLEIVELDEDVSLFGGYTSAWDRGPNTDVAFQTSVLGGMHTGDTQFMTVRARDAESTLQNLTIIGPDAVGTDPGFGAGFTSYGVHAVDAILTFEYVIVEAGDGADGADGDDGATIGGSAPDGLDGDNGTSYPGLFPFPCSAGIDASASTPAEHTCNGVNVGGGKGGRGGSADTSCSPSNGAPPIDAYDPQAGTDNLGPGLGRTGKQSDLSNGGAGGTTGNSAGSQGGNGQPGIVTHGTGGSGGGVTGFITANYFYGSPGSAGTLGEHGSGGGGGAGGIGSDLDLDNGSGGAGGGGGAGGCRGESGERGTAGGASIGVFGNRTVLDFGSAVVVNQAEGGQGGSGGDGTAGQSGGVGGSGGAGGGAAGDGGDGAPGADGGTGGAGGGGAGGSSFGVLRNGGSLTGAPSTSGGTAGSRGLGGSALNGAGGGDGSNGTVLNIRTCANAFDC